VSHFHVGATSQSARDTFYPSYRSYLADGRGVQIPRSSFDTMTAPHRALMVGSPQEIIDKLMLERELFGLDRFMGQVDLGGLPRSDVLRSIELFASDVAPVLRRELP
jgi:alkanesulfonate monooxygenase SsuD/methylene tetrahydromethanopterin reductase-like flavin-dependent oxidoreductase (luciferase family)